jgi:hypothetical protein
MSIRHFVRTLPLVVAFLGGLPAGATTQLRVDLPELARNSDAVVHGVVRRVESRWSGDKLRVTQPGGRVGDIGQVVHGLASFTAGEEVVVFLEKRGARAFRVAAMAQGKYQVQRAGDGKSAMAVPEPSEALLLDPATRQPTASALRPLTLTELKSAVRAALQSAPAQQEKAP